jgi:broad specificity phosphatase PhoE
LKRVLFVRHGSAGDRKNWSGDDRRRRLDEKGRKQAAALAGRLLELAPVGSVLSSPYVRCVETVQPLADARGATVEEDDGLAEGSNLAALDIARRVGDGAALCTHGDVMDDLLGHLARHRIVRGVARAEKGSAWVLEFDGERVVSATYLPPPS